jgi:hypothetical protein
MTIRNAAAREAAWHGADLPSLTQALREVLAIKFDDIEGARWRTS